MINWLISLKKKEIFSLIINPIRNKIIQRLNKYEKASYSGLFDSANEHIHPLSSTGNFNYHLNFLINNDIIRKEGIVYKLSDKGKEIARFVKDVDQKWFKLERIIRGGNLSLCALAESFEEETGLKMNKEVIDFKGSEMIMDDKQIIGIFQEGIENKFFSDYKELDIEKFSIQKISDESILNETKTVILLKHPELDYYLSPKYYGIVEDYLERYFGKTVVYANVLNPSPFLFIATTKNKRCSFVIAPSFFDKNQIKMIEKKEK